MRSVWPLLLGSQWQTFEVTLLPTKSYPKAHHDFLCHEKAQLSLQVVEAVVKMEENSLKPGHEQDLCWGVQELQVPTSGQPLWRAEEDSTSHTLGDTQSSKSAAVRVVSCTENQGSCTVFASGSLLITCNFVMNFRF